jgi:riboflavin kinase / FMN adenylyltransferase
VSGTVATVGSFDGIHRGHQAVLAALVRRAQASGAPSVLVTFEPHPLAVVTPSAAPRLLTPPDEKWVQASATGVERVETLAFTPELAQLGPEEFVRDVLLARLRVQALVVGYDHGFGRDRSGDVELVRRLAREHGFALDVVDAVTEGGQPISSSLIRAAVTAGDLVTAERGLGRRYSLRAAVTRGAGRGRTIGVPTINLTPADPRKLLPPDGVYAVWVQVATATHGPERGGGGGGEDGGERYGGMMNQGPRPTFGVHARGLEIHLFDFRGDLYDTVVTVEWVRRLRDVQTFASRQALVDQIERDAVAARSALKG